MHICLITPSFPPMVDGGVAIATGRLVERLLQRGHRVTVLTSELPSPAVAATPHPLCASGHLALHGGLVQDPLHAETAVADLCRWAQAQRQPFDVFLAYFAYPGGYVATVLAQHLGLPVVCSCRGNDVSKDLFIAPQTLATVLQRSTRLLFVSDSLLRMADTLVPCRAKSAVVANAVDCDRFTPSLGAEQPSSKTVVLGTSGLMRWKKGLELFLPLMRDLCATHDVRFLIAGYALEAAVDQHIAAFLAQHGLQGRLDMLGPLPHEHMAEALHRLDIYVTTSYQEGMPNGVLEAMACALPVVATAADGIPQLVEDGVTGYLCAVGDVEAVAARCRQLIGHPALRRHLGQAGRRRVQQHFHPDHEAALIEEVLRLACTA